MRTRATKWSEDQSHISTTGGSRDPLHFVPREEERLAVGLDDPVLAADVLHSGLGQGKLTGDAADVVCGLAGRPAAAILEDELGDLALGVGVCHISIPPVPQP